MSKTWFVTGASKGLGLEIVKAALRSGDRVVATARDNPDHLDELSNKGTNPDLLIVKVDVTDEHQIRNAVEEAVAQFGTIDVLVNNAGFGTITAVEEASDAMAKNQFATNVFGLLNVTRAVLPIMRKQRSGHVINISSLFAFDTRPGWGLYSGSKAAVEAISQGLYLELAGLGVKVTVAAPGFFNTNFLTKEAKIDTTGIIDDYKEMIGAMRARTVQINGNQPGDPEKFGEVIVQLANAANPPLHLLIGRDSVAMYRANVEKVSKEVAVWEEISDSTDRLFAP